MIGWRLQRVIVSFPALLLLLLLGYAPPMGAQGVTATGTLSEAVIPFHRVATYTIRVNAPADAAITIAPWAKQMPGLTVQRGEVQARVLRGGRQEYSQVFQLTPSMAAKYELPTVQVTVGEKQVANVEPVPFEVRDLTGDERAAVATPLPLLTLEEAQALEPGLPWGVLWGGAAVMVLVAVGIILVHYVGRNVSPATPRQGAEARIRALTARLEKRTVRGEAYYVELSDILREFVARRFQVVVHERSTPEVAAALGEESTLSKEQVTRLVALLRSFDGVKFARRQPTISEMLAEAEAAIDFLWDVDDVGLAEDVSDGQESAA